MLLSAKRAYLGGDSLKISETMYKNSKIIKGSFLPVCGVFA